MRGFLQAITEILTVAIVILTQSTLIVALAFLVALLVIPDNPLILQTVKWLGGLK